MIDSHKEWSMNLELSEDQEFFRDTTRKFLAAEVPLSTVRDLYDEREGFSSAWWRAAAELGWTSLFVPEALGGGSLSGRPTEDAMIVAEEMGRLVSPGPFLPVNLVAACLASVGSDEQQAAVLPGLLAGDTVATWAFCEPEGRWEPDAVTTDVAIDGDTVLLNGAKAYVEAAGVADHFLVTGRGETGLTQVLVPAGADGVTVRTGRSIDMTRRFGTVQLAAVRLPASAVVGQPGHARADVDRLVALALALQCAEMVGVAERTLEFTLEYGAERVAFGRPIVSFQALKHRIADMTVAMEGSKAVSDELAKAVDGQRNDMTMLASVAKAYVGEQCLDIVDDCVQITGGIGVTWEHDIHLYNRRAAVDRAVYGTPEEHKERVFAMLEGASV
jgi:alkylation response protein AidB-like acyl-CoA dehydrogenase